MDPIALFTAVDHKDADAFTSFLAEGVIFRMGSRPPVSGRETVREFVKGFFETIRSSSHTDVRVYKDGENHFLEGIVTYVLLNDAEVALPFVLRLRLEDGKAAEYRIYFDPTPVTGALA